MGDAGPLLLFIFQLGGEQGCGPRRTLCIPMLAWSRPGIPRPGGPCLGMGEIAAGGLLTVDCEGFMASIAHDVVKAVRRLGLGTGPPGPHAPADCAQFLQSRHPGEHSVGLPHPHTCASGTPGSGPVICMWVAVRARSGGGVQLSAGSGDRACGVFGTAAL